MQGTITQQATPQVTVREDNLSVDAAHLVRGTLPNDLTDDSVSERRLWTAVLINAIEDWRGGSLRARREAQRFLFEDRDDFAQVCSAAGLEPDYFRNKLSKIGKRISMSGVWHGHVAA